LPVPRAMSGLTQKLTCSLTALSLSSLSYVKEALARAEATSAVTPRKSSKRNLMVNDVNKFG
jgi:hypothetical protein